MRTTAGEHSAARHSEVAQSNTETLGECPVGKGESGSGAAPWLGEAVDRAKLPLASNCLGSGNDVRIRLRQRLVDGRRRDVFFGGNKGQSAAAVVVRGRRLVPAVPVGPAMHLLAVGRGAVVEHQSPDHTMAGGFSERKQALEELRPIPPVARVPGMSRPSA